MAVVKANTLDGNPVVIQFYFVAFLVLINMKVPILTCPNDSLTPGYQLPAPTHR